MNKNYNSNKRKQVEEEEEIKEIEINKIQKQTHNNEDNKSLNDINNNNNNNNNNNKEFKINIEKVKLVDRELKDNSLIRWSKDFMDSDQAELLYNHLYNDYGLNYEHSKIKMYGKEISIPRLQSWMADKGVKPSLFQKQPAREWSPPMLHLKERLETLLGCKFDYVLINYYRNGQDYIGLHSDREASKNDSRTIASVSLGATRRFILKHNLDKTEKIEYSLTDGSLLVMGKDTQKYWKHQVPKEPKVLLPRINLTFRKNNL